MDRSRKMHDIVCSECGAHDMVPFKPREGSVVKCKTCFGKGGRKSASKIGGRRDAPERAELFSIECSDCGNHDMVPFEPRPGSEVLCRECHSAGRDKKQRRQKYHDRSRVARQSRQGVHIPRLDHGTRVSYPISCESCGKDEILDYVPKTSGPIMCRACSEQKFGKSWYQVKLAAEREAKVPRGRRVYTKETEIERPNPERLDDFEALDDLVKVRRS